MQVLQVWSFGIALYAFQTHVHLLQMIILVLGSLVCGGLTSGMYDCMFMGWAKIIIYGCFFGEVGKSLLAPNFLMHNNLFKIDDL